MDAKPFTRRPGDRQSVKANPTEIKEKPMFIQLKKAYFGKQPGERVDVEEPNAKTLIDQGIAEAAQRDHLGSLIEKQIGGMLEGLTRGLNETITKTLEQFAKSQTLSRKNAVPAIFGESGEGDPKKNFGDRLVNVAIAASKNAKRAGEAQDRPQ